LLFREGCISEAVEQQAEKDSEMSSFSNDSAGSENSEDFGKLDRTHELTWALLDEELTEAEMGELEHLLRTDGTARESYVRCMQLHADLASHFAPPGKGAPTSAAKGTPILGFLTMDTPFPGVDSPTADGAR
jgi:hypothetical protein